jgi:hypothetical protein
MPDDLDLISVVDKPEDAVAAINAQVLNRASTC